MSDMKLYKILENFDKVESAADKLSPVAEEDMEVDESQTKVQNMGNKVRVTTDGDSTEFDDAETAAAFMGTDDDNQFATESADDDDGEKKEWKKPWEKDDDDDDDDDKETVTESGEYVDPFFADEVTEGGFYKGDDDETRAADMAAMDAEFGIWDDTPDTLPSDEELALDAEYGVWDDEEIPEAATCEDEGDGPEFATFDSENEAHRKRLQRGTPVVLDKELFTDQNVNRRGIFVSRSPSGDYGRVVRDVDGKEVKVHLSDIKSADLVNNSVYEEYELNFDAMLAEDEDEKKEKWGVFSKGGSIGGVKDDKPLKTFDDKADATADAKRRRKGLSKGEKSYYGMGYSVKKINEDITMTQTTNMDNPENDTTTVTAVGQDAGEELAAMMANAGLNTGEYAGMDAPPIDAGPAEVDTGEAEHVPVEMPMGDMIGMMDDPMQEAFGDSREKPLQKELIVYPNMTFDRSQALRLPPGTMVEFARGGDDYRNNIAKIVAGDQVWFTWNDAYYEALSDREIEEGNEDWVDGNDFDQDMISGYPGNLDDGPSNADLDSIDSDPEWELDFDMDEPLSEDDIAYLSNEIAQAIVDGADIYDLINDESVPQKDREALSRDIDELMLGGDDEVTAYDNLAQRIYDMYADADMTEERDIEHANTPDERMAGVDMVTHGTSGGLNRPKRMYKPAGNRHGDNAMQRPMKEADLGEELSPKMQARKKADREKAEVDFDMSRRSKGSRLRGKGRGTGRADRSVKFGLGEGQKEQDEWDNSDYMKGVKKDKEARDDDENGDVCPHCGTEKDYDSYRGGDTYCDNCGKDVNDLEEALSPEELEKRREAGLEKARADRDWSSSSRGSRLRGKGRGTGRHDRSVKFGLGEGELDDNTLVNEHESVDSFLNMYKEFKKK